MGLIILIFVIHVNVVFAQQTNDHQDTLKEDLNEASVWWDLQYYHLEVEVFPEDSLLKGVNTIHYEVLDNHQVMQIDLQRPLSISRVTQNGKNLDFKQKKDAYLVKLNQSQEKGDYHQLKVFYEGHPKVSKNPPWNGGITWKRDKKNNPLVASSSQNNGASIWWPCKDHWYDEPDSMRISVTVPENLVGVSNGRLQKVEPKQDTKTFHWKVANPINNYGVTLNVGNYVSFTDTYQGLEGTLDCTYYVLQGNKAKARRHFQQVPKMLEAFEYWMAPYPFYEDGFKLVQTPFLGMEHQSAISYGNGFSKGYDGKDLSQTGYGMAFDFIIIHEAAHEWFGNSVTVRKKEDMWVHEAFASYAETLYLDYHKSSRAGNAYVQGTRNLVKNNQPITGSYSGDMYFKGANMLHTLRQIINDDEQWRNILQGIQKKFYHQTVSSRKIEKFIDQHARHDLKPIFDQYLRTIRIPVLEYRFIDGQLQYRWTDCVENFNMPVKVYLNGDPQWLSPNPAPDWSALKNIPENPGLKVDQNFYVGSREVNGGNDSQ